MLSLAPSVSASLPLSHRCIHAVARSGFQFAKTYDSGRPGYSAETLEQIGARLHLSPSPGSRPRSVVEVGAGTGKFTRLFLDRYPVLAAAYTAVEPVRAMREALQANCCEVRVMDGSAGQLPLPDGEADAVIAAQAFHWFANLEALAEMHRVLRPGGSLCLIWNSFDVRKEWVAQLEALREPYYPEDVPRFTTGNWKRVFEEPAARRLFGSPGEWLGVHLQLCSREQMVDRIVSSSAIAMLPQEQREDVAKQVLHVLDSDPETTGRTQLELPYSSHVYVFTKQV